MKPIRLEIEGINSYAEKQVIDFKKLTSKGIFGIFGKTGSGKSTILDAITLALYGNISRGTKEFINSDKEKGRVDYEFEIGEGHDRATYRVSRRFKRNKDNGNSVSDGFIRLMKKNEDGEYEVIEDAKVTEVNKRITNIIGLEESDFLRSVVLPQGKFSEFLTLSGKDRRNMLERIFSLQEYGSNLNSRLASKKKSVSEEVRILEARLGEHPDISEELRKELEKSVDDLKKKILDAEKELEKENKVLEECTRVYNLVLERDKIEETLKNLSDRKEEVDSLKARVKRAEQAAAVKPEIEKKKKIEETIESIGADQEKVLERRNKVKKDLEEYKEEFEEVKKKYDSMGFVLSVKKDIESIGELNSRISSSKNTVDELVFKKKKLKGRAEEVEDKLKNLRELIKVRHESIEGLNREIKANSVMSAYREKVFAGLNYHRDIYKFEKNIEGYEKDILLNEAEIEKLSKEQEALKQKRDKKEEEIGNIIGLIIEQEKIEVLSDDDSEKLDRKINSISREIERLKELERRKKAVSDEKKAAEISLKENMKAAEDISERKKSAEKEISSLKKADDRNSMKKLASDIRNIWHEDFHKGDICPVCGSSVDEVDFGEHLNSEFEQSRQVLEEKNRVYQSILIEEAKLEANREVLKEKISEAEKNIVEIDKSMGGNTYEEVLEKGKKYEEYRNSQRALLKNRNSEIERLRKVREKADSEKNEYDKKIIAFGQAVSSKKEVNEKSANKINTMKKDMKDVQEKLDEVSLEIQKLIGYNKISFAEINRDFYIEQKDKINSRLEKVEKLSQTLEKENEEYRQLEKSEENLNNEKNQLEKEIAVSENRRETILDGIKRDSKEVEEKKKSIDFERLNSIIMFGYSSIEQLPGILDSFERIVNQNYKDVSAALEESRNQYTELEKNIETNNTRLEMNAELLKEQSQTVIDRMKEIGFENEEEVMSNIIPSEMLDKYRGEVEKYEKDVADNSAMKKSVLEKLGGESITEEEKKLQEDRCMKISDALEETKKEYGQEKYRLEDVKKKLENVKDITKKLKAERKLLDNIRIIDDMFRGNRFVEYLSQIYLENIVIEASERLFKITNGRYTLEINDSYQFVISDNFNGGLRRSADTLSGGEVFLTSLSLALALSSQIQLKGSAPLEFFFLDEGFGTLDSELLNTVMSSLEKLYSNTLSVGIISHVEEIKARIPMKLEVYMDETLSSSVIREIED